MKTSRTTDDARTFRLVVGLPHTNRDGLAEHLLLMHAGHLYWQAIAHAIGRPLSALRSASGDEVYATFYFIEEHFPDETPLSTFRLDDTLRFAIWLRAFKNVALEGRLLFDRDRRLRQSPGLQPGAGSHPFIKEESYLVYRSARIEQVSHVTRLVHQGLFKPHTPLAEGLLALIKIGLKSSPFATREFKNLSI